MKGNATKISNLDITTFLMDHPDTNTLLDDYEFSPEQIRSAMTLIVDKWNETRPPVGTYSIDSFPYRYHMLVGTCSILLRSAAHKYRRNDLDYNIGGGAINDQKKAAAYTAAAGALSAEFKEWMTREKNGLNMNQGWGFDW